MPLELKAGDQILFGKWSGTEVKLDGEQVSCWLDCDFADKDHLKSMLAPRDWDGFEITVAQL